MPALTVTQAGIIAPGVRQLTLKNAGGLLPGFTAGAHVQIDVPGVGLRDYSLVNLDAGARTESGVEKYVLGVRLLENSKGGSRFMHRLAVGDRVNCREPQNDFPLGPQDNPLLIAGGIGITPIASMVGRLAGQGADYDLHYAGRSDGSLAFLADLQTLAAGRLKAYTDGTDSALDLTTLLAATSPSRHVYVCGPKGMIEATKSAAAKAGFAPENIHFELFTSAAVHNDEGGFEVEISSTGKVYTVPVGQTIIQVLEAAGVGVMYDCTRGDCGICLTTVSRGTPDHRDVVLTGDEKAAGNVMQICVSRACPNALCWKSETEVPHVTFAN